MRVLILGGGGMLGHRLWLAFRDRFDTFVVLRRPFLAYERMSLFQRDRAVDQVDVLDPSALHRTLERVQPDVVATMTLQDLVAGRDPQLERGLQLLTTGR